MNDKTASVHWEGAGEKGAGPLSKALASVSQVNLTAVLRK